MSEQPTIELKLNHKYNMVLHTYACRKVNTVTENYLIFSKDFVERSLIYSCTYIDELDEATGLTSNVDREHHVLDLISKKSLGSLEYYYDSEESKWVFKVVRWDSENLIILFENKGAMLRIFNLFKQYIYS